MTKIDNFFDGSGKLKAWPSKYALKIEALYYLGLKFEFGRIYTEKEVNKIINEWHSFGDYFLLRRGLIEEKILMRTSNGAKYWKADIIKNREEIGELALRNLNYNDANVLLEIERSYPNNAVYAGRDFTKEDAEELINGTMLPPGGSGEFFHVKLIAEKEQSQPVGYIAYYLGYPNAQSLFVASLFFHNDYQHNGYGTAIADKLSELAKNSGFSELRVGVMTENKAGFAFWAKQKFEQTGKITSFENGKSAELLIKHL